MLQKDVILKKSNISAAQPSSGTIIMEKGNNVVAKIHGM
jgi:hypothetical protein